MEKTLRLLEEVGLQLAHYMQLINRTGGVELLAKTFTAAG
jgi:hypothetical protein